MYSQSKPNLTHQIAFYTKQLPLETVWKLSKYTLQVNRFTISQSISRRSPLGEERNTYRAVIRSSFNKESDAIAAATVDFLGAVFVVLK